MSAAWCAQVSCQGSQHIESAHSESAHSESAQQAQTHNLWIRDQVCYQTDNCVALKDYRVALHMSVATDMLLTRI